MLEFVFVSIFVTVHRHNARCVYNIELRHRHVLRDNCLDYVSTIDNFDTTDWSFSRSDFRHLISIPCEPHKNDPSVI